MTDRRFWGASRINRTLLAVCIALLCAAVIAMQIDTDKSSILTRGDFPGFYGPAVMVWEGLGARLYDLKLQGQVQNRFWPSFDGAFYISVYPPHVAILLSPLALLSDQSAKWLSTILMGICAWGGYLLVRRTKNAGRAPAAQELLVALLFPPVLISVLSTQNTGLSMLLLAIAIAGAAEGTVRGRWYVGLALGALLFKPQFAAVAILLFTTLLGWQVLVGAALCAVVWYLSAVPMLGVLWPQIWVESGIRFGKINQGTNPHNFVSLEGLVDLVLSPLGVSHEIVQGLGWLLSFLLMGVLFLKLLQLRRKATPQGRYRGALMIVAALPLIFPQTLFYDLGISALAVAGAYSTRTDREIWGGIAAYSLLGLLVSTRDSTLIPLLAPVSVAAFLIVWHSTRCQSEEPRPCL